MTTVSKAALIIAGIAGATALGVNTASASSYSSIWVNSSGSVGNCHGYQNIIEGYNGASHEYQEGEVVPKNGARCQVLIMQRDPNNFNSSWETDYSTSTLWSAAIYDGPGYQVKICVNDAAIPSYGDLTGWWCSPWH